MFRTRLASLVVAASLAMSGCACFDHPWFDCPRRNCCPAPCDTCSRVSGGPIVEGPVLPLQEGPPIVNGQPTIINGQPPIVNGQPRLVPTPQSMPMPYVP